MQPNEMAGYLRRGLGRVVLFLRDQNGGTVRFRDVISHAVLHDVRYDRQSEAHRAPYLYQILQATGEPHWYAARLCDALGEAHAAEESDEEQRCEIAARFAAKGNENARRALYAAFERSVRAGEPVGTESLIALDGAVGFQTAAALYQSFLPPDENLLDWWYVDKLVEKLGGDAKARQVLDNMATNAPELGAFLHRCWEDWEHIIGGGAAERRQKVHQEHDKNTPQTYEAFQAALDEVERAKGGRPARPLLFRHWGRTTSPELLLRLALDISRETNIERLRHLLLLFDRRPFPLSHDVLLPLTLHDNLRVAFPAVYAASRITHPDVRTHALHLLQTGRTVEGMILLVHNPGENDATLFINLLRQTDNEEVLHRIDGSLREYHEAQPSPDLIPVLLTLYEKGPCSMCRGSTVDLLIKANALPDALRSECRYDADKHTREAVAPPEA